MAYYLHDHHGIPKKNRKDRSLSTGDPNNAETRVSWHSAFLEAIQLELRPYRNQLEFKPEYQLTTEPLRIDLLIIKKPKDLVITKNIAAIFRGTNIIEYKSPDDYISVEDFYKVYGYACLYVSLNRTPITDITVTFVENRHPQALISHLKEIRKLRVEEREAGIYTVGGDMVPIQIIESRRLGAEENTWLKDLDHSLTAEELLRVSEKIEGLGKAEKIGAYVEALFLANPGGIREVLNMSDEAMTLEKVFEEAGLISKWEARGEARGEACGEVRGITRGKLEVARKLIAMGLPLEQVAEATGLDMETIRGDQTQ
jgi:hypothetical protein